MHQCTKAKPNWSKGGAVISADVHTHSPLHKLYLYLDIYLYIFLHLYMGQTKIPKLTDIIITPYLNSKAF